MPDGAEYPPGMGDGRIGALILAGGRGERLGSPLPKAFVPVAGVPMLVRAVEALGAVGEIDRIQPVVPLKSPAVTLPALDGRVAPAVPGGAERQDSVAAGLAALGDDFGWVVVHDAARCLVSPDDVRRVIAAARASGAAILARPATDTLKRVKDGAIAETLDRSLCWAAQTPQVFRTELLREAHNRARADGFVGTDDAQLVERTGAVVSVVEGHERNLKITGPADLALAERWLEEDAKR